MFLFWHPCCAALLRVYPVYLAQPALAITHQSNSKTKDGTEERREKCVLYPGIVTHHFICRASCCEQRMRFIYVVPANVAPDAALEGVGTAAAWPPGTTPQLSPLQLFPFDLLICHLKKKASRAATQTLLSASARAPAHMRRSFWSASQMLICIHIII